MNVSRQAAIVAAILVTIAVVLVLATTLFTGSAVEDSSYAYSVTIGTDAALTNFSLALPLPVAADGSAPIATAVREEKGTAPDEWRYAVVETERGPTVRLDARFVPAESRTDGRQYATYQYAVTVPAADVVETGRPFGPEPTIAPGDRVRERPCPNLATPDTGKTCYAFDSGVAVAYDAPTDAMVTIDLVHTGVNDYAGQRFVMYYERVSVGLQGPHDGWIGTTGFASTDEDA